MSKHASWLGIALLAMHAQAPVAHACGGFFCGRQPVDQTAERILFKVGANSVTMVVQIAYAGSAPDFAWVLPLAAVPDKSSLGVFPQRALTALDTNTGPQFIQPDGCFGGLNFASPTAASAGGRAEADSAGVTVHYRAEVGPYDVFAVESADPMALYDWLIDNDFNVNAMMLPYIRSYTQEGLKFLALKLMKDKDTSDITPLRFDLPGQSPSIPLRMTALAAEPEMGILVFVIGETRFSGANWPDVKIKDEQIVWRADRFPIQTNWAALVARGVDQAGGLGWVTELAGSTSDLVSLLANSQFGAPEDMAAAKELTDLIGNSPYISRLYSRLSPEEMTVDPVFHKTTAGDVSNMHKLSAKVDGVDQCPEKPLPPDPCLFTSCGAGGICRPVLLADSQVPVAGCGCVDGASARTTFDPASVSLQTSSGQVPTAAVACQDQRLSFVNPGDTVASGEAMPDPCLTFDCGANGTCMAVNMTPTCVCEQGHVAVGSFLSDGTRTTKCRTPMISVPKEFYTQRLPDLPATLPGGRKLAVDSKMPVVQPNMNDLGSNSGALPAASSADSSGDDSDDCSISAPGSRDHHGAAIVAALFAACVAARRRRSRC